MVKKKFSETEKSLIKLFNDSKSFTHGGDQYDVIEVGKPSPSIGECKTDIYILTSDKDKRQKEFKISVKQHNADFLENKIKLERAIEILGNDAQSLIEASTTKVRNAFESEQLVFIDKKGKTGEKCITLGWKFEFMNKPSGGKSGLMQLTDSQKHDIYAGTNLPVSKINCTVNKHLIANSGIADYILEVDPEINQNVDFYISKLVRIEDFVRNKDIYFACKALNYRAVVDKWDGNRPLAVYIDWNLISNKLIGNVVFSNPLSKKGNEIGENIQSILKQLGISTDNFKDIKKYLV